MTTIQLIGVRGSRGWLAPSPCLRRHSEPPIAPLKLSLSLQLPNGRLGEPRDPSVLVCRRESRLRGRPGPPVRLGYYIQRRVCIRLGSGGYYHRQRNGRRQRSRVGRAVDARGEERPLSEEREAHRGRELLGLLARA